MALYNTLLSYFLTIKTSTILDFCYYERNVAMNIFIHEYFSMFRLLRKDKMSWIMNSHILKKRG